MLQILDILSLVIETEVEVFQELLESVEVDIVVEERDFVRQNQGVLDKLCFLHSINLLWQFLLDQQIEEE